ncbi:hypothetical protein [Aeromicrobium duanguangcaii]|uniref:Uncharacterized protein n=1 Tax=Aeromicrobium duanguangcaii TaxID=2968086 RepID=A0ABY5KG62_9ACTN|nr:hypothetical protein [Aeromicrobium duanguangcaii]MCD9154181.1 hypothetical protein [Aeromicrobium duanguangcaii]MCL3837917.1 hypothetical protein [Aeromicrobium duanguangcaii]UUI68748.1 hypothetical protein NP095_01160 [Aeromicrobium duanguangcaii]
MSDRVRYEWSRFSRSWWGPVHVVVRVNSVEATVGESRVVLDLTDRRPADVRRKHPMPVPFREGVPVELDGQQVAVVTNAPKSPLGIFFRRAVRQVSGDPSFVLPGMRLTLRALPVFLTLRADSGTLVSTRRWGAPWDDVTWHFSLPGRFGVVPPRVARGTRPEHVAFWFAMRETHR